MYLITIVVVYWFMQSQAETIPTFFGNINNMNSYPGYKYNQWRSPPLPLPTKKLASTYYIVNFP